MIKSDTEIEKILMLSLREPYIEFKSSAVDGDRQKLYRFRKRMMEDAPLLGLHELVVRVRDKEWIVLEWKGGEPLEIKTEPPTDKLEIRTSPPKPKKSPSFRLPQWLEEKANDYKSFRDEAAHRGPEYRLAWEQLDTLVTAVDYLIAAYEVGKHDVELEKLVRSADLKDVLSAFLGQNDLETDPIEILRLQIAEIPSDDIMREVEKLKLIERREKLMLERDIRLQSLSPLDD